jgi:hypothetical protein
MPKSVRHHNAARKAKAAQGPVRTAYKITDPNHMPDLKGEFAGVKVKQQGGAQVVLLTPSQAKFYLDSGAIEPLAS